MTALRLYLIRHGETAWSLSGQHTGRTDIPLTARGEAEASTLRAPLALVNFNNIFTSPRQRARRTAELSGLPKEAQIEPELREWDYGQYEGKLSAEIRREQPDWNIYRDGCPDGESATAISDRADGLIARLKLMEGNVALFSHGHFSRVLATRWIGLPLMEARRLSIDTASLSILGFEDDRADKPVIVQWNSVAHKTPPSS